MLKAFGVTPRRRPTPGESLLISPDIGNTSAGLDGFGAAPEPTAWSLMILGLASMGSVLRRRRAGNQPGFKAGGSLKDRVTPAAT